MKKDEVVTKKYLDKKLDEHTRTITQTIVKAVDGVLVKRLSATETKFDRKLEEVKTELKNDINNVKTLVDGYVNKQEGFKQEFEIEKAEMKQVKKVIKDKLDVEIRAI
jgi:hypothetical protein